MGLLPEYINDFVPSIGTNKYTIKEFEAQEEKGIIFLPNNGYRDTEYNRQTKTRDVVYRYENENGYYWTSTPYSYDMSLAVKTTQCAFVTTWLVYRGFNIRPVKDIK